MDDNTVSWIADGFPEDGVRTVIDVRGAVDVEITISW